MTLDIRNLTVKSGEKVILKDLNLRIEKNEIHAIMGPNGSGKSTLSKVIAGYPGYEVEGEISYESDLKTRDLLSKSPDERSQLGIFLAFQYPVELAGVSNFTFLRAIFNAHAKKKGFPELGVLEFQDHLREYVEKLGVDESFLERYVNHDFSGGEKKRNEMLQLLLLQPKLALLDETDSGLDVDSLKLVANAISSMRDTAFMVVTHYNRILDYIKPDFVHVMIEGRIVKSGSAELASEIEKRGYSWL